VSHKAGSRFAGRRELDEGVVGAHRRGHAAEIARPALEREHPRGRHIDEGQMLAEWQLVLRLGHLRRPMA
jgi:hypothetical protein